MSYVFLSTATVDMFGCSKAAEQIYWNYIYYHILLLFLIYYYYFFFVLYYYIYILLFLLHVAVL